MRVNIQYGAGGVGYLNVVDGGRDCNVRINPNESPHAALARAISEIDDKISDLQKRRAFYMGAFRALPPVKKA